MTSAVREQNIIAEMSLIVDDDAVGLIRRRLQASHSADLLQNGLRLRVNDVLLSVRALIQLHVRRLLLNYERAAVERQERGRAG